LRRLAGGGISIEDAALVTIAHNTIARNDSTATAGAAFTTGVPDLSAAQPGAGIVSHAHSAALAAEIGAGFSNPVMEGNIIWQNRQFVFAGAAGTPVPGGGPATFGLCPDLDSIGVDCSQAPAAFQGATPVYGDLGVIGSAGSLACTQNCWMTADGDPGFVASYFNGNRNPALGQPEQQTMFTAAAFDEGGNFIRCASGL